MGEAKGIKVDRKEGKTKYSFANPPLRSFPLDILEDEKLLLFDVDLEDDVDLCAEGPARIAAISATELANPSFDLGGIDVVISDPTAGDKLSDSINCNHALFLLASSFFCNRIFPFLFMNEVFSFLKKFHHTILHLLHWPSHFFMFFKRKIEKVYFGRSLPWFSFACAYFSFMYFHHLSSVWLNPWVEHCMSIDEARVAITAHSLALRDYFVTFTE